MSCFKIVGNLQTGHFLSPSVYFQSVSHNDSPCKSQVHWSKPYLFQGKVSDLGVLQRQNGDIRELARNELHYVQPSANSLAQFATSATERASLASDL